MANGAPDILRVALRAGYASHEAFSRAFRDQFGQCQNQRADKLTSERAKPQRPFSAIRKDNPVKESPTVGKPVIIDPPDEKKPTIKDSGGRKQE